MTPLEATIRRGGRIMSTTKKTDGISPFRVSKMVTDRQKAAGALGAVLDRHGEEANSTFAALVEPFLREGEEAPDLLFLQEVLRRRLGHLKQDLVEADEETSGERREDCELRRLRNAAVGRLANLLSRLRAAADATYGPGATAQALGMEGPVPRDPVVLHRLGLRVLELLPERPFANRAPQVRGIRLDFSSWAEDLEGPVDELGGLLHTLTLEQRDSASALIRKQQAMRTYDVAYQSLLQVMEGLLRHTGLEELSKTVRPCKSSRPRPEEASPQPGEQAREETSHENLQDDVSWPELKLLRGGSHPQAGHLPDLDLRPRARKRDPTAS